MVSSQTCHSERNYRLAQSSYWCLQRLLCLAYQQQPTRCTSLVMRHGSPQQSGVCLALLCSDFYCQRAQLGSLQQRCADLRHYLGVCAPRRQQLDAELAVTAALRTAALDTRQELTAEIACLRARVP